ncbi:hypothetical protein Asulf_01489 [Archaeoglobus sulfaticallidus PM70-1]|uniref:Uncharacterized protein n=1 Tax=Archaeoglobus sulfaticallidus PM70-1 TaxID=387631 RepID=N0BGS4_9EURY|nr:hypothetical protein [Archaeoglobus sulfaticallidus]AGK61472.1 hypothetical protein Asulf_01489 [Archaeoglobus sulfaticallidus PM70-1]
MPHTDLTEDWETTPTKPKLKIDDTSADSPKTNVTVNLPTQPSQTIRHEHHTMPKPPEIKVTLTRGQKGSYGWEITYNGTDSEFIISKIKYIDEKLRKLFLEDEP